MSEKKKKKLKYREIFSFEKLLKILLIDSRKFILIEFQFFSKISPFINKK